MKKALSLLSAVALSFALFLPSAPGIQAQDTQTPQQIIVKFKKGVTQKQVSSLHLTEKSHIVGQNNALHVQLVQVPKDKSLQATLSAYQKNPLVEYAEPNITLHAFDIPDDPRYNEQYGPQKVHAPEAWDVTKGSEDVEIAIVDTGVDYNHPDLAGKVVKGKDFVDNDLDPLDMNNHGTHCAGIAAALTNNGVGIAGIAPNVKILAVRVLDARGSGTLENVANGITYAADQGAKVISLSLGSPQPAATLRDAVNYAVNKGVVVVAAAGNSGNTIKNYPGAYPNAIGVAATDSNDNKAYFSTYGTWVDIAAPGLDILSSIRGGGYAKYSGTSMATPLVAGVAGLLASQGKTNEQIRADIEGTADKIAGTGNFWANGRVNALAAVNQSH